MTFRDSEKERYRSIRPLLFESGVEFNGNYKGNRRHFCLSDPNIGANLYRGIRVPAMEYFVRRGIRWHDGLIERLVPSNHLCCSQSCCVNFFYPMVDNPELLEKVFTHFYPDIKEVLPIEQDRHPKDKSSPYLVFEWIGTRDYLNEQKRKKMERTRGANYTSADFAFRFRCENDDKIHLVVGEWKYTESYGLEDKGKNEVRKQNYREAFIADYSVFTKKNEEMYSALFFEPFYQLMRLQLLAQEMEKGRELDADIVSVLHICPDANKEFKKTTSPYLKQHFPDTDTIVVWKQLVPDDKFMSKSVEEVLSIIVDNKLAAEPDWANYLKVRYGWAMA